VYVKAAVWSRGVLGEGFVKEMLELLIYGIALYIRI